MLGCGGSQGCTSLPLKRQEIGLLCMSPSALGQERPAMQRVSPRVACYVPVRLVSSQWVIILIEKTFLPSAGLQDFTLSIQGRFLFEGTSDADRPELNGKRLTIDLYRFREMMYNYYQIPEVSPPPCLFVTVQQHMLDMQQCCTLTCKL